MCVYMGDTYLEGDLKLRYLRFLVNVVLFEFNHWMRATIKDIPKPIPGSSRLHCRLRHRRFPITLSRYERTCPEGPMSRKVGDGLPYFKDAVKRDVTRA